MTTDVDSPICTCLEEVLDEVQTLDGQLADPLTLEPAIQNLEGTIVSLRHWTSRRRTSISSKIGNKRPIAGATSGRSSRSAWSRMSSLNLRRSGTAVRSRTHASAKSSGRHISRLSQTATRSGVRS